MPESIIALWRNASPLKRLALAGVPAVLIVLAAVGTIVATSSGGEAQKQAAAPTQAPATATKAPATATPVPVPTATPEPPAATDGGSDGGTTYEYDGGDYETYEAPVVQSGPGPIQGTNWSLTSAAIGLNASVYSRTIGDNGAMGDPSGAWQAIWYDFGANNWTGLGGVPGEPGANAVFAGHVDYIGVGPAVFYSIGDLQPGDIVTINTDAGSFNYSIQWSNWAAPDEDFTNFVAQTGQESITLVTCVGSFSGGHYSNRLIVRGVRV